MREESLAAAPRLVFDCGQECPRSCLPRPPALSSRENKRTATPGQALRLTHLPAPPPRPPQQGTGNAKPRTSPPPPLTSHRAARNGQPLQGWEHRAWAPGVPSCLGHTPATDGRTLPGFGRGVIKLKPAAIVRASLLTTHLPLHKTGNGEQRTSSSSSPPCAQWTALPEFGKGVIKPAAMVHASLLTAHRSSSQNEEQGTGNISHLSSLPSQGGWKAQQKLIKNGGP